MDADGVLAQLPMFATIEAASSIRVGCLPPRLQATGPGRCRASRTAQRLEMPTS